MENESERRQYGHVAAAHKEILPLVCQHLEVLEKKVQPYFPNISSDSSDWLRNTFIEATSNQWQLNIKGEEELPDTRNDLTLKLKHGIGS